ncbi:hypothetical protein RHOSPDRAFT_31688 [Rhodotorula sp. JG-1b]|nr:hypothetical protein RHOSPDRAFT_31688 [Rhodotorula sp. JG-1b]
MTSPAPPSSSSFSHSTPALAHRHVGFDASSSSPPTDVIATPSDRHDAPNRSKNGKHHTRRSVRIRTSSSGHFDSSPQVLRDDGVGAPFPADSETELSNAHPAQPRSVRGTAGQGAGRSVRTPRVAVPFRGAGPTQETLDALAQAQAHGITPDQFEAAKQQIMRFLRDEATNGGNQPPLPVDLQAFAPPALARAHAHPSVSPVISSANADAIETPVAAADMPYRAALSRTPTASSQLQAAFELDASRSASRPRPRSNFDDVVGRSVKRQKRDSFNAAAAGASSSSAAGKVAAGSAVLQWAQEDSSSSSSDEDGSMLASILTSRRGGAAPSVLSPGLGVPSPATAPTSDTNASPSIPSQRGMMDRFMSTQPAHVAAAPEATVPQVDLQVSEEPAPPTPTAATMPVAAAAAESVDPESELAPPVSPVRQRTSYPAHVLQSPAPSKPPTSILFSPDVARLLRSELDELEANALAGRQSTSPSKAEERRLDSVMEQSSPSQRKASPLSGPSASRTRDIFSQDHSGGKRTRWSGLGDHADAAPTSPTPSSASYSMRAPSFCDSSPAASERGPASTRFLPTMSSAEVPMHPASAPDFLYGGPPSSSPTSSHHSDFVPHRLSRSSPGPHATLARSDSMSSADEPASVGRAKRTAARRDTAPILSTLAYQGTMNKPPYSYAALIGQALFSTPDLRMALADIYTWIMQKYPYFRKEDSGWQNSIRHNLSLNQCFIKTQRGPQNPGKGCLWAIKPGTEDQFVDGDFVRKNGQGNTRRRGKGSPSSQQQQQREEPTPPAAQDLLRDAAAVALTKASHAAAARSASPSAQSAKSNSPTPSVYSNATSARANPAATNAREYARAAYSPAPSTASVRSVTPAVTSPATTVPQLAPPVELAFTVTSPSAIPRPASAAAMSIYGGPLVPPPPQPQLAPPAMLCRSQSSMGFLERSAVMSEPSSLVDIEVDDDVKPRLEPPAPLSRTSSMPMIASRSAPSALEPPPASPPRQRLIPHEPLLSTTMSPPTSVYQRLAGPYQPLAYSSNSLHSHRALALLSSPEAATGIMPGRGSPSRPRLLTTGGATGSPPSPATAAATFTTGAGPARKRQRTDSQREYGMLSPTALVHLSSPVSSIRGGARAPMSPVQDKLATFADPEKRTRRVTGTRLLPAVNALASSDFDPFRSPPPSSASSMSAAAFGSAKYHLRSPSARLQAALSTPGGTKGRVPLGFSPSLATGASWERSTASSGAPTAPGSAAGHGHDDSAAAWNELYGGPVDTELEHFGRRAGMRSAWPSPGANAGHLAW